MTRTTLLLCGLAAAAIGLPAEAATAATAFRVPVAFRQQHPVPAGQVQHTVTETTVEVNGLLVRHERVEAWNAAAASRAVTTDVRGGALIEECTGQGVEFTCFSPRPNLIRQGSDDPLLNASWLDQAAWWRAAQGPPAGRRTGTTTEVGRRAVVHRDDDARDLCFTPGRAITVSDVATGLTLRHLVTTDVPGHGTRRLLTQVTRMETLDAATVPLTMAPHPGARVAQGHKLYAEAFCDPALPPKRRTTNPRHRNNTKKVSRRR